MPQVELFNFGQSDKYLHVVGLHRRCGDQDTEHILGTLLVVDGYTAKGKNKHECTGIERPERNSDEST